MLKHLEDELAGIWEANNLKAKEVERLEATITDMTRGNTGTWGKKLIAEGREQAAMMYANDSSYHKGYDIAAAIRAEIVSATVSHADGADSTDTRSSDG